MGLTTYLCPEDPCKRKMVAFSSASNRNRHWRERHGQAKYVCPYGGAECYEGHRGEKVQRHVNGKKHDLDRRRDRRAPVFIPARNPSECPGPEESVLYSSRSRSNSPGKALEKEKRKRHLSQSEGPSEKRGKSSTKEMGSEKPRLSVLERLEKDVYRSEDDSESDWEGDIVGHYEIGPAVATLNYAGSKEGEYEWRMVETIPDVSLESSQSCVWVVEQGQSLETSVMIPFEVEVGPVERLVVLARKVWEKLQEERSVECNVATAAQEALAFTVTTSPTTENENEESSDKGEKGKEPAKDLHIALGNEIQKLYEQIEEGKVQLEGMTESWEKERRKIQKLQNQIMEGKVQLEGMTEQWEKEKKKKKKAKKGHKEWEAAKEKATEEERKRLELERELVLEKEARETAEAEVARLKTLVIREKETSEVIKEKWKEMGELLSGRKNKETGATATTSRSRSSSKSSYDDSRLFGPRVWESWSEDCRNDKWEPAKES